MQIFVSYSTQDDAAVRSLVQDLEGTRQQVWMDQKLTVGEAWWTAILEQIRGCTVFLLALSDHALRSKPCRAEISYAEALGLPILSVQIGEVESYRIDAIFTKQLIDYRDPSAQTGVALFGALHERAAQHRDLPDPLPEPPPIPYEYLLVLGKAIEGKESLSYAQQSAILTELRQAFLDESDASVRADIRKLLGDLRRRPDATNTTVREIDFILHSDSVDSRIDAGAQPGPGSDPPHTTQTPSIDVDRTAPASPWWRRPRNAVITAVIVLTVAATGITGYLLTQHPARQTGTATAAPTSPAAPPPPVAVAALDGLLLSPADINTAMGATAMTVKKTYNGMGDDTARVADKDCLVSAPAESAVYAGSGWTASRSQELQEPGDNWTHLVSQTVVLFRFANDAAAFFTTSIQRWPACANRQYTITTPGTPNGTVWTIGPVTNTNSTLSTSRSQEGGNGYGCERALTVRNNVAIDIAACSSNPADSAVTIAHQIAAKVPTQ